MHKHLFSLDCEVTFVEPVAPNDTGERHEIVAWCACGLRLRTEEIVAALDSAWAEGDPPIVFKPLESIPFKVRLREVPQDEVPWYEFDPYCIGCISGHCDLLCPEHEGLEEK